MRLVAGCSLIQQVPAKVHAGHAFGGWLLAILTGAAALLLMAGLWTPIGCAIATLIELWSVFSQPGDARLHILLAALCAALALLGPGAWSVDARLFGWKRIDIPGRKG